MESHRQGDLLFVKTVKPRGKQELVKNRIIAKGTATGHTHKLRAGTGKLIKIENDAYVVVALKAYIDHQEHDTTILSKGVWKIITQREYEPEGWRYVQD